MRITRILFYILLGLIIFLPANTAHAAAAPESKSFKAKIIEISEEKIVVIDRDNIRYDIARNEQGEHPGIKAGKSVVINSIIVENGDMHYVIADIVRTTSLWILIALFIITILIINGRHGAKSLVNLVVTLGILILGILPLILKGFSPVTVAIAGGIISMIWNIYFSHGFNRKSHAALLGIALSLILVGVLSSVFVKAANLSGLVQEEAVYLQAIGFENINMQGLLLAAIIIGVLGVLDDLAINQVSVIEELKKSKPTIENKELMSSAIKIGRDHTGAIVNTLMLAYAGAAFPLLLLVTLNEPPFETLFGILNNEIIATEIVRTLVGTICIVLTMPITTLVAAQFYRKD